MATISSKADGRGPRLKSQLLDNRVRVDGPRIQAARAL